MTRQFDASLQRLGKLLYTFFKEEKIESFHEQEALLKKAADVACEEYMLARSVQAGREGVERIRNQTKNN